MFEYHGWATVSDSVEEWPDPGTQAADGLSRSSFESVANVLATIRNDWQVADLRIVNGSCHVWLAGLRNHRQDAVVDAFREVAVIAPWSYGLLQVHDDEAGDDDNRWITWVMKRGAVDSRHDTYLSPHIGKVEDPLD